jgi:hypothetical protein
MAVIPMDNSVMSVGGHIKASIEGVSDVSS